ncbi:hypothetical protein [Streptomyces sp. NPDC093071]|uniref:hypothetical protein n=1 Tax=Streptomyces sp. NPDC093071 TaxID=3366022 RepID=UPI0037F15677
MEGPARAIADRSGTEVDDELLLGQWTVDPTPSGRRASDPYAHAADTAAALPEALDGMDIKMVATFDKDQLRDVPVPDNVRTVDHLPLDPLRTDFTLDHGDHLRSRTAHRGPPLAYLTARRQR